MVFEKVSRFGFSSPLLQLPERYYPSSNKLGALRGFEG